MKDTKTEILTFWFAETKPAQWFQKNPDFDETIRARFESDYHLAVKGIYDGWQNEAKGSLALIVLLDQFPRNMFRGTPRMFAADDKALDAARYAVEKKQDALLAPVERSFIYLPLEHSENLQDQKKCVKLFKAIQNEYPVGYDYAVRHLQIIEQFGRFPHRNAILGRPDTDEEKIYLARPDAGF